MIVLRDAVAPGSTECRNLQDCHALLVAALDVANKSKSPLDRVASNLWVNLLFDNIFEDHLRNHFPIIWEKA